MSKGLIMTILGTIGAIISIVWFLKIKRKDENEINEEYRMNESSTVIGNTVKAYTVKSKNISIDKNKDLINIKNLDETNLDNGKLIDNDTVIEETLIEETFLENYILIEDETVLENNTLIEENLIENTRVIDDETYVDNNK